jgi:hypothetical protein
MLLRTFMKNCPSSVSIIEDAYGLSQMDTKSIALRRDNDALKKATYRLVSQSRKSSRGHCATRREERRSSSGLQVTRR